MVTTTTPIKHIIQLSPLSVLQTLTQMVGIWLYEEACDWSFAYFRILIGSREYQEPSIIMANNDNLLGLYKLRPSIIVVYGNVFISVIASVSCLASWLVFITNTK